MQINGGYHLTYCTNIHPGEDWATTFQSLKDHVPTIKTQTIPNDKFGLGLRLSNVASQELNESKNLLAFKEWLQDEGIYVFTMNGFPYGNFHGEVIKDQVHQPDWTTSERVIYTKRLFSQLNELIPEGISGGISTSPISYKHWYKSEFDKRNAFLEGAKHLVQIAAFLFNLEEKTGNYLHLDIEPEPDGLLENTTEVLSFFRDYLIPIGVKEFQEQNGIDKYKAEVILKRYLTICYDICHFSLAFEEPSETFEKLAKEGIKIGKVQVSAALKVFYENEKQHELWDALTVFNEPTYLHQVTQQVNGEVKVFNDLPLILKERQEFSELRAHFHVPIFLEKYGLLHSTQDHILKVIDILKKEQVSDHLEIETYTWDVLPKDLKIPISDSIIREINWFKNKMQ